MSLATAEEKAVGLREASQSGQLGTWTKLMTDLVVATCGQMGWAAAAKDHPSEKHPVSRHEYLALDVMAFRNAGRPWEFPVAIMELENSQRDEYIAYSLWKVLCVRAGLRAVYCYRRDAASGAPLIQYLEREVVRAMDVDSRGSLSGDTLVVIGNRGESETFPDGFFRWWQLDRDTGHFRRM